jgi:hypothetical protein
MVGGQAFLSAKDLSRVVHAVDPPRVYEKDVERLAITALRSIAAAGTDVVTAGAAKRKLLKAAQDLKAAYESVSTLPTGYRQRLDADKLLYELERVHHASEALAAEIVVRRSGGGVSKRRVARQKAEAAKWAFDLLYGTSITRRRVPLTRGGPYFELAGLLFHLATGRAPGDMERACAIFFRQFGRHEVLSRVTAKK